MKKIFITALSLGLILTQISCNNDTTDNSSTSTNSTPSTENTTTENTFINSAENMDVPTVQEPNITSNNGSNVQSSNTALNPPHGQPGHRCDIPEGAPLNTPPQQQAQAQPIQDPAANPANIVPNAPGVNVQPSAQQTAPGFSGKPNPEHGQPGHRCDLQVGQILP